MDQVHQFHNFGAKLMQESLWPHVVDYVHWQAAVRKAKETGQPVPDSPNLSPISINLDLTTACNYRCDHCIDWDILNSGVKHDDKALRDSLAEMAQRGLKSVILIGGGEPTVHPRFADMVRYLKQDLHMQVAVVSNGGRNDRIHEVAECFTAGDWVRLSLDSGSEETFQAMHKPRQAITLDEICEWVPKIKDKNPQLQMGFSFIITWKGAQRDDTKIVENIHELLSAAQRAKQYRFDYISIKPFLVRAEENGSEVMDPSRAADELQSIVQRIRASVDEAKKLQDDTFRVVESTNLRLLESQSWEQFTQQPSNCHMQFFHQVLTPHGVFNCPAHRSMPRALITGAKGYKDEEACQKTQRKVGDMIVRFDAAHECSQVTCLYNGANWWIEKMIQEPAKLAEVQPQADRNDCYL